MSHDIHAVRLAMEELAAARKQAKQFLNAFYTETIADHPDLAELNVQLDGFYGDK